VYTCNSTSSEFFILNSSLSTRNQYLALLSNDMKDQLRLLFLLQPLLVGWVLLLACSPIAAQKKKAKSSIFEDLKYKQMVEVILETNLDSLINHRNRNTYQKGFFTYADRRGKIHNHKIKLRPRGKFRRRICDFPMIKIDFPKKALKKRGLAKYDDYKLVTHCLDNAAYGYESVAREYLAYKLYNILSPTSYRVQLLYFTYLDSKEQLSPMQQVGFIIEDTAELEDRVGGEVRKESAGLLQDSFDVAQYNFVALFQYMIGNTDWTAYPIPRYVKAILFDDEEKYKLVPFDFDFSGLVAAPYAVPRVSLNQRSIRQRIYLGIEEDPVQLRKNVSHFLSKKKKILRTIKQYDFLSKQSKKDIWEYVNSFFAEIESVPIDLNYPVLELTGEGEGNN